MSSYGRSGYGGVGSIITPANTEILTGDFRYESSIDPELDDLYAKWSYATGSPDPLPLVVLMHGFTGDAGDFTDAIMQDMARAGFFGLVVGMRGRNGASGTPDVSGREIVDIIDAVERAKTLHAGIVDPDRVHIAGWSGGGANALAAASKFPDYFAVVAAHFPLSDYGFDETFGWGNESPNRQAQLAAWIGARAYESWSGSAPVNLNAYRARNTVEAIPVNRLGGHIYLFHDASDTNTAVTQSNRVATAMETAENDRISLDVTTSGDDIRWLHDLPHPFGDADTPAGAPVRFTRGVWGQAIRETQYPAWTIPEGGVLRVIGYIVTKRFSIWLGDGTEHVADVEYDAGTGVYTVTPLTGEVTVSIQQGELSVQSTISTETELTVE